MINYLIRSTDFANSIKPDYLSYLFKHYFGIEHISNVTKGLVMLLLYIIFLSLTIYLRKKGIYDIRSGQEQWQEKVEVGYYARLKKDLD